MTTKLQEPHPTTIWSKSLSKVKAAYVVYDTVISNGKTSSLAVLSFLLLCLSARFFVDTRLNAELPPSQLTHIVGTVSKITCGKLMREGTVNVCANGTCTEMQYFDDIADRAVCRSIEGKVADVWYQPRYYKIFWPFMVNNARSLHINKGEDLFNDEFHYRNIVSAVSYQRTHNFDLICFVLSAVCFGFLLKNYKAINVSANVNK